MILHTDRLIIRRFTKDDWQDLHEYLSDEQVVKFEPYGVYTEDDCRKEAERRSESRVFWAVCLKETEKLIGNLYFQEQEPKEFGTWVLGYVFNRAYGGQGYATEGARRMVEYAFTELQARRIIAMCNPDNTPSWRLMERLCMRREGHLKQNVFFKRNAAGQPIWCDTLQYALLADEWFDTK